MEEPQFSLKVGAVERYDDLDSGETRLRVPFDIMEGKTVLSSKIESFPLATTTEEIKTTLKRHLDLFTSESASAEADKDRQDAIKQSDQVVEEISNFEL